MEKMDKGHGSEQYYFGREVIGGESGSSDHGKGMMRWR